MYDSDGKTGSIHEAVSISDEDYSGSVLEARGRYSGATLDMDVLPDFHIPKVILVDQDRSAYNNVQAERGVDHPLCINGLTRDRTHSRASSPLFFRFYSLFSQIKLNSCGRKGLIAQF